MNKNRRQVVIAKLQKKLAAAKAKFNTLDKMETEARRAYKKAEDLFYKLQNRADRAYWNMEEAEERLDEAKCDYSERGGFMRARCGYGKSRKGVR